MELTVASVLKVGMLNIIIYTIPVVNDLNCTFPTVKGTLRGIWKSLLPNGPLHKGPSRLLKQRLFVKLVLPHPHPRTSLRFLWSHWYIGTQAQWPTDVTASINVFNFEERLWHFPYKLVTPNIGQRVVWHFVYMVPHYRMTINEY